MLLEEPGQVAPTSGAADRQEPEKLPGAADRQEPEKLGTIRGTVTGPQGPVESAAVILGERVCATDKSGNYEFAELPPGTYEVFVVAPQGLDYSGQPQKVVVESGQVAVVDFTVEKPKAVLEVYVYNEVGAPVEGAVVSGVLIGTKVESGTTDNMGLARFEDVVPGDRYARVKARGYVAELQDFKAELGTTMRLDFHLRPGAYKISGSITSSDDGRPMVAQVELMKKDLLVKWLVMQKTTSSDKDGNYEIPDLDSGEYGLAVTAPYYQPGGWTGSVSADTRVDFKLYPAPKERRRDDEITDVVLQKLAEEERAKEALIEDGGSSATGANRDS
jgi:hypothetical protein